MLTGVLSNVLLVADYFLVRSECGPDWDHAKPRRQQAQWDEHAAFMDALAEEGVVVLGGPLGEAEDDDVLVVAAVESEAEIRSRLADDPWTNTILSITRIEPWSVWLRGPKAP
jgi:uncharacterized protein YciI